MLIPVYQNSIDIYII